MSRRTLGPVIGSGLLVALLAACSSTAPASSSTTAPPSSPTGPSTSASSGTATSSAGSSTPAPAVTESNPPGDIPDNQAYVAFRGQSGRYSLQVPEGWARTATASSTSFTDKLNSITVAESAAATAPTVASATSVQVPALASSVAKFQLGKVAPFTRAGGSGILITYLADSPQDPVTGKVVRDAVQSFLFWHNGTLVTVSLSGPQNADNVDPWAKVSGSFRWTA